MKTNHIDFSTMNIPVLFGKFFIPTVVGLVSAAAFTITDGIIVGIGVGSDGLAAVNIVAPFFMLATGLSLMFGVGSSVVASIHISQGKIKAANINITQAIVSSSILMLLLSILVVLFCKQCVMLLGSTVHLQPLAMDYLYYIAPGFILMVLENIGLFIVRIDGMPRYAMLSGILTAITNIILDYLFVITLGLGIKGAAIASVISFGLGAAMTIFYLSGYSNTLKWWHLTISRRCILSTIHNVGYMIKLGSSALLTEVTIAMMMLVGNYVFIFYLGEDGVAAFSVACYCYPVVFMINNAVAQSAQPIISHNYGSGNMKRVKQATLLMIAVALTCGSLALLGSTFWEKSLVALFLNNDSEAYHIATTGIPYFALGFIFFSFNIAAISYYQSIERAKQATLFAILRGFVFLLIAFLTLPSFLGQIGIWLSVPCAEIFTSIIIVANFIRKQGVIKTIPCQCYK